MTTKHTPGPWHKAEANTTIPIKAENGKTVASVKWGENDNSNADLIAAAPDLLAALEHLVNMELTRKNFDAARAAIAKARGAT